MKREAQKLQNCSTQRRQRLGCILSSLGTLQIPVEEYTKRRVGESRFAAESGEKQTERGQSWRRPTPAEETQAAPAAEQYRLEQVRSAAHDSQAAQADQRAPCEIWHPMVGSMVGSFQCKILERAADGALCSGEGRRTTKQCSSDASETERLLNVKPEVVLGSLTAGYVISDDCQTSRLHNAGTTPNLGAPLDTNQHNYETQQLTRRDRHDFVTIFRQMFNKITVMKLVCWIFLFLWAIWAISGT